MKALSVAIEAALAGGSILKSYYGGEFRIAFKGELDLVTQADTESEAEVLSILRSRMPGVSILAEESGVSDRDEARRFVVDPLDGTTNFAHSYPMFAVSIGYEEDGRVRAGVVYDPIHEELFTGESGRGAFLNGTKLEVSIDGNAPTVHFSSPGFPTTSKMTSRAIFVSSSVSWARRARSGETVRLHWTCATSLVGA